MDDLIKLLAVVVAVKVFLLIDRAIWLALSRRIPDDSQELDDKTYDVDRWP